MGCNMVSCALIGEDSFQYRPYQKRLLNILEDLIKSGVTTFYNIYQGSFSFMCAHSVHRLKTKYPHITNVMILPFITNEVIELDCFFDKTDYLVKSTLPPIDSVLCACTDLIDQVLCCFGSGERMWLGKNCKRACGEDANTGHIRCK